LRANPAHQFRRTLGTRLINNDVAQEVVRKLLDHTSTAMTAHYVNPRELHQTGVFPQVA
jgi:integrase